MKRNFVIGLFGGLIGSAMLLIFLSATGIVGARGADIRSDVARTNEVAASTPLTSTFTYQGQLKNGSSAVNAACQMAFRLYDDPLAGVLIGTPITSTVPVTNGLFTVGLNFGSNGNVFNGNGRWLDIKVNCGSGFVALIPRQPLTAVSYALALPGLYTQPNATSPNIIGGYSGNVISSTVVGGVIGGGGQSGNPNRVHADYGTVGGGRNNTASNYYATVDGGVYNTASGLEATVGGGYGNIASGNSATVPGGLSNIAAGDYSFAAGQQAKANHYGAFVWADSTGSDFTSTANYQFLIRANGGVGIGTNSPAAQLNVSSSGSSGSPQLRIDQTNSADYARLRFQVSGAANYWDVAIGDGTTNVMNFWKTGTGNVMSLSGGATHITMIDGATESGGTWNNFSDRNAKENFTLLDSQSILARVANLPIQAWNYKTEDAAVRHIGPMAQDFYAAFNVGADDKHISTVDEGGVALAAIKGLYQENQDLKARIAQLEQNATATNPTAQPEPFNVSTLLSVIAVIGFAFMWLQQRRSKRGQV